MLTIKFTVPLAPVTKKNSQRIITIRTKKGSFQKIMPSAAFEQYQKDAGYFIPHRGRKISYPCEVVCLFYMPTRRDVDLTNLEEAIDDVMVFYGLLADDNSKIIVSHDGSRVLYDKDRPRTEVTIRPML
jgi:Holliday junction resolvase RusA-like endonuclease